MRYCAALLATFLALPAADVGAQTTLTGGRKVLFRDAAGVESDRGTIRFAKDAALLAHDPRCPTVTSLQISSSNGANAEIPLACEGWELAGSGYRYRDRDGVASNVRSATYRAGKLGFNLKGAGAAAVAGPVDHVEVRVRVDGDAYCGRFETFSRNSASEVLGKKPSVACNLSCGNGAYDDGEECDDGDLVDGDGCDSNCRITACGNDIVTTGETCDDGNVAGGDGCRSDCTIEACGDAIVDPGEDCDDGNTLDGDCCSSACGSENGQPCSDGDLCTTGDTCDGTACVGAIVKPWINEIDYDDFTLGGNIDVDEFIEIAGPAGTDLGGYKIVAVEGNASCATGFVGVNNGEANFTAVIPSGTVLPDTTGLGVGLLVVCFSNTSDSHELAGECDLVVPAPNTETNLQNGHLTNADAWSCPDGVLLLDPADQLADAVSYEGTVPNVGNFGSYFHVTPYSIGQDQGFKARVSYEKTTDVGRATSSAEWDLSGGCTNAGLFDFACVENSDSPGVENPGQDLHCPELYCGDTVVSPGEQCDEGLANSDDPDATCRTDCTVRRCGDGIVDAGAGETCEAQSDCLVEQTCFACECVNGTLLGELPFSVIPGPSATAPTDDGESTWLKVSSVVAGINNGSQGNFNPGPLVLEAGLTDDDGIATLLLKEPAYLGANAPSIAGGGKICFRLEQDPAANGFVDCDGGSNVDASLSVNSNGAGANGTPTLTVGGAGDSGAGAAIVRVLVTGSLSDDPGLDCATADYTLAPPTQTALTTGTATGTIFNPRQGGVATSLTLAGQPFDCDDWTENSGASIVLPNVNMDVTVPFLGTYDLAQLMRLNDD
jgi:cysteine-rich repeat protein